MSDKTTFTIIILHDRIPFERFVLCFARLSKALQFDDTVKAGEHPFVRGEVDLARFLNYEVHSEVELRAAYVLVVNCVDCARLDGRQIVRNWLVRLGLHVVRVLWPCEYQPVCTIVIHLECKLIDVVTILACHQQAGLSIASVRDTTINSFV